jgi:hypothetical protein
MARAAIHPTHTAAPAMTTCPAIAERTEANITPHPYSTQRVAKRSGIDKVPQ